MRNFKIIGVTGPTGSGKSTITAYLKGKGCYIIDADRLGRQALQKGSDCLVQTCVAFGDDILNADGTLNRQLLAKKAFSTPENTQRLNNITHPWICMQVIKIIDDIRKSASNPVIMFDAAVLFESKMDVLCDSVIAVVAPLEIRKERIMKRDNLTPENADIRINAQNKDEFYISRADYVIDGGLPLEEKYMRVDEIIDSIIRG